MNEDETVLIITVVDLNPVRLPEGTLLVRHRGLPWRLAACIPTREEPADALADRIIADATGPMRRCSRGCNQAWTCGGRMAENVPRSASWNTSPRRPRHGRRTTTANTPRPGRRLG